MLTTGCEGAVLQQCPSEAMTVSGHLIIGKVATVTTDKSLVVDRLSEIDTANLFDSSGQHLVELFKPLSNMTFIAWSCMVFFDS